MSKKGGKGGFGDDFFKRPFGGLFDFNRDGKEDLGEQWIAYQMFQEAAKEDDFDSGFGFDSVAYGWRQFCEDGSEYGVYPEDYKTEEEYEEALEEAKYGWRDIVEDGSGYGIDPEDYETEEEYEEALEEAKYGWRDIAEDGSEYGIDPEDYTTAEDYEEALENAQMADADDEDSEYEQRVECCSEKSASPKENTWRNNVPDGSEYGLDPCDYDTEQDYLAAFQKEKYAWRERCGRIDTLGLDPAQFETEDEYDAAWLTRYDEEKQKRRQERLQRHRLLQEKRVKELADRKAQQQRYEAELMEDKTIYSYCGVKLPFADRPYSFRTDDGNLKIGDTVIVPIGKENKETEGVIVSIGQYARIGVPFPVEKTKFIIRKALSDKRS